MTHAFAAYHNILSCSNTFVTAFLTEYLIRIMQEYTVGRQCEVNLAVSKYWFTTTHKVLRRFISCV